MNDGSGPVRFRGNPDQKSHGVVVCDAAVDPTRTLPHRSDCIASLLGSFFPTAAVTGSPTALAAGLDCPSVQKKSRTEPRRLARGDLMDGSHS